MKLRPFWLLIVVVVFVASCSKESPDKTRTPLLEVEGKFLYLDQVEEIIPPNVNAEDSAEIASRFIRKWVTDVLLYENAKRNITNKAEIDKLLEEYRKSLIIHAYQQRLIEQRLPKQMDENEMLTFYEQYSSQLSLRENIIKGILLIVPNTAPRLANVRSWVQSGNAQSLENIEKYSLQNAISYDYFANNWIPFSEILKKIPVTLEDPASFISSRKYFELSDSTRHYLLKIEDYRTVGQVEPFEMAKDKISNLLLNKSKIEFISNFEDEIYNDAIKKGSINYFRE